jgi:hypothetical protein
METIKHYQLVASDRIKEIAAGGFFQQPNKRRFNHGSGKPPKLTRLKDVSAKEKEGFVELAVKGGFSGKIRACQMNPSKSCGLSEKPKSRATLALPALGMPYDLELAKSNPAYAYKNGALGSGGIEVYQRLMMEHLANLIDEVA